MGTYQTMNAGITSRREASGVAGRDAAIGLKICTFILTIQCTAAD